MTTVLKLETPDIAALSITTSAAVSIAQEAHKIAEINLQVRLKIKQAIQQRSPKRLSHGNCCELLRRCAPLGQLSEEC